MCEQILDNWSGRPWNISDCPTAVRLARIEELITGQPERKRCYLVNPHWPPMIRLSPGRRRRALDHIQPVHVAIGIAALGEVADVADIPRKTRIQEVGVERDDYVGLLKIVARLDGLSEGQLRAFEHVVAIDRLINMPLRLRINLQEV